MKHIAIIGSGPAGCYLADHLLRLIPDASIDILERLPVPFGLIRYGVAPDHQSTKAVARVFDRVLARDRVSFFGNVEVGRDVQLDELAVAVRRGGAGNGRAARSPARNSGRRSAGRDRLGRVRRLVQRPSRSEVSRQSAMCGRRWSSATAM